MPDRIIACSPMSLIEERMGIVPIETLLAERATLTDLLCDVRAKFGSFGTFDHIRKMELARLAGLIRAQAMRDKIRLTAAEVDDATHDHPDYRELITEATVQRADWCRLEAQVEAIDFQIRRAEMVGRYLTSEARL